jgi:hypothetical protein
LVSLDDPVSTMAKYRDPECWKPQCLLMICTNSAPKFPSDDGGCETRLAFLNMPFKFTADPANDSERYADSDVKLVYMPACVPEFLFWGPLLVQGMLRQKMGRHLEPRPAQIAADTRAAFCTNSPTDIPELARSFCDTHLRAWRKELGAPSSRTDINARFERTHPAYKAGVVLPRELVTKKGNTVFSVAYNGTKIGVYKQVLLEVLVTVTLKPLAAALEVAEDEGEEESPEVPEVIGSVGAPAEADGAVGVGTGADEAAGVGTGGDGAAGVGVTRDSSSDAKSSSTSEKAMTSESESS